MLDILKALCSFEGIVALVIAASFILIVKKLGDWVENNS